MTDKEIFKSRPIRTKTCPACKGCGTIEISYSLHWIESISGAPDGALCASVGGSFDITTACVEAIDLAKVVGRPVVFDFNGKLVVATADGDSDKLVRDWWLKVYGETPEQSYAKR